MNWYHAIKYASLTGNAYGYWVTTSQIVPVGYQEHENHRQFDNNTPLEQLEEMERWIRVRVKPACFDMQVAPLPIQIDMLETIAKYHGFTYIEVTGSYKRGAIDLRQGQTIKGFFLGTAPASTVNPHHYMNDVSRGTVAPAGNKKVDRVNWRNRSGD